MVDCSVILYFLFYCHRFLKEKMETLLPKRASERTRLNMETFYLIFCGIFRLAMDFIFYFGFPLFFLLTNEAPCLEEMSEHLEFTIVYLIIGTYLMHHLSIIVILKLYKPGRMTRTVSIEHI